jgi:uncharacterized protein
VSLSLKRSLQLIALLLLCVVTLAAERVDQLTPSNYVNDFAHVLDEAAQQRLNALCQQIDQRAHAQLSVVTVQTVEDDPIDDFANRLYQKWGIGDKKTDRGVLILLAVRDRHYRVEVGYGLEGILNDAKVGTFGREAVPQLRLGDYAGAVTSLTGRVADVIAADANIEPVSGLPALQEAPARHLRARNQVQVPGWVMMAGTFLFLLMMLTSPGRALFWLLLSSLLSGGGGGGGWSSGGGDRDGDSFGGFGGGRSGGGGASGDW